MEGACIFRDDFDVPNLLMYKEINNNLIFYIKYNKYQFVYGHISIYDYDKIIPKYNIHIMNHLPLLDNQEKTIELWRNLVFNRLNIVNNFTTTNLESILVQKKNINCLPPIFSNRTTF